MSFDIYIQAFSDGEPANFDRTVVERAFADIIFAKSEYGWRLQIERIDAGFVYIDDDPEIMEFSVSRPPIDEPLFMEALFSVLKETSTALFWPGSGDCACVARSEILGELPTDFLESVGRPTLVACASDIRRQIVESLGSD